MKRARGSGTLRLARQSLSMRTALSSPAKQDIATRPTEQAQAYESQGPTTRFAGVGRTARAWDTIRSYGLRVGLCFLNLPSSNGIVGQGQHRPSGAPQRCKEWGVKGRRGIKLRRSGTPDFRRSSRFKLDTRQAFLFPAGFRGRGNRFFAPSTRWPDRKVSCNGLHTVRDRARRSM